MFVFTPRASGSFQVRSAHPFVTERLHPIHEDGELLLGGASEKADRGMRRVRTVCPFRWPMLLIIPMASRSRSATGSSCTITVEAFEEPLVESGDAVERLAWMSMNRC
jgi:hypothetical protein